MDTISFPPSSHHHCITMEKRPCSLRHHLKALLQHLGRKWKKKMEKQTFPLGCRYSQKILKRSASIPLPFIFNTFSWVKIPTLFLHNLYYFYSLVWSTKCSIWSTLSPWNKVFTLTCCFTFFLSLFTLFLKGCREIYCDRSNRTNKIKIHK